MAWNKIINAALFLIWDLRRLAPSLSSQIQLRPSAKHCCLPPKSPTFVRALGHMPLKRLPILLPVFPACVRRRVGPNEAAALPTCHLFVSRHGLLIAPCAPFAASPNRTPSPCPSAHQEEEEAGEIKDKKLRRTQSKSQKKNRKSEKKQECQKKNISFV